MHELSLATRIVEIVDEELARRGALRARVVRVLVGDLAVVEAEALRFCFDAAAKGSRVEGGVLEIERVVPRARCEACSAECSPSTRYDLCPSCGGRLALFKGTELRVKDVEVE